MEIDKILFKQLAESKGIEQSFEDFDVNNDGVINEKDNSVIASLLGLLDEDEELVLDIEADEGTEVKNSSEQVNSSVKSQGSATLTKEERQQLSDEIDRLTKENESLSLEAERLQKKQESLQQQYNDINAKYQEEQKRLDVYTEEYYDSQKEIEEINNQILKEQEKQENDYQERMQNIINNAVNSYNQEKDGDFDTYLQKKMDAQGYPIFSKLNMLTVDSSYLSSKAQNKLKNITTQSAIVAGLKTNLTAIGSSLDAISTRLKSISGIININTKKINKNNELLKNQGGSTFGESQSDTLDWTLSDYIEAASEKFEANGLNDVDWGNLSVNTSLIFTKKDMDLDGDGEATIKDYIGILAYNATTGNNVPVVARDFQQRWGLDDIEQIYSLINELEELPQAKDTNSTLYSVLTGNNGINTPLTGITNPDSLDFIKVAQDPEWESKYEKLFGDTDAISRLGGHDYSYSVRSGYFYVKDKITEIANYINETNGPTDYVSLACVFPEACDFQDKFFNSTPDEIDLDGDGVISEYEKFQTQRIKTIRADYLLQCSGASDEVENMITALKLIDFSTFGQYNGDVSRNLDDLTKKVTVGLYDSTYFQQIINTIDACDDEEVKAQLENIKSIAQQRIEQLSQLQEIKHDSATDMMSEVTGLQILTANASGIASILNSEFGDKISVNNYDTTDYGENAKDFFTAINGHASCRISGGAVQFGDFYGGSPANSSFDYEKNGKKYGHRYGVYDRTTAERVYIVYNGVVIGSRWVGGCMDGKYDTRSLTSDDADDVESFVKFLMKRYGIE